MSELLRRDGHLLDLAIDRYLAGELRPDQVAELEAHAGACAPCAAQVAEARQDVALPPVAWPERQAEVVPLRPRLQRRAEPVARAPQRWWLGAGGLLAAAAAALILVGRPTDDEAWQVRGDGSGAIGLEVYRQGLASERLFEGAEVHAGDTLGFRVRPDQPGQLLIVGLDATGAVYPCFPADGASAPIEPKGAAQPLDGAITLDATAGDERVVALRCPEPVALIDVGAALGGWRGVGPEPTLHAGCAQEIVRLHKVPGGSTP